MGVVTEFMSIAWPGLLVLAGMCLFVVHGVRQEWRRHPHGRYREHP